MSCPTTFPWPSIITPGITFVPGFLGPTPDKNNKFPTRLAWGYIPTGSGALSV